jgi:hypothetical protein
VFPYRYAFESFYGRSDDMFADCKVRFFDRSGDAASVAQAVVDGESQIVSTMLMAAAMVFDKTPTTATDQGPVRS